MKKSIRDVDVTGKRLFCRMDFNVPMDNGTIADDTRIQAALPTIRYLIDKGAKVILATHLGRPGGTVVERLRVDPIAERLCIYLNKPIKKFDNLINSEEGVANLKPGEVALLENLRFHPGEEANEPKLALFFAGLADIFVNDAFGVSHRAHASNVGIATFMPAVSGLLVERELSLLGSYLSRPKHPFVAIMGGAKISDKIGIIRRLLPKVDSLLIGGGLAFTFLLAQGGGVGNSLVDTRKVEVAKELISQAKRQKARLFLPLDIVLKKDSRCVDITDIPPDGVGLDIGPKTRALFASQIAKAGTILWNGPLGLCEDEAFAAGTRQIAKEVAESTGFSIIGGGDSIAAIKKCDATDKIDHISTGGGAMLSYLEGRTLPGIEVLEDKEIQSSCESP